MTPINSDRPKLHFTLSSSCVPCGPRCSSGCAGWRGRVCSAWWREPVIALFSFPVGVYGEDAVRAFSGVQSYCCIPWSYPKLKWTKPQLIPCRISLLCAEDVPGGFQEPFPTNQVWLFSGSESLKTAVERSLWEVSLDLKGFHQRTERWHLPCRGSYGSYADLGNKSAKPILLT